MPRNALYGRKTAELGENSLAKLDIGKSK